MKSIEWWGTFTILALAWFFIGWYALMGVTVLWDWFKEWRTRQKSKEDEELMPEADNPPKEFIERKEELDDALARAEAKRKARRERNIALKERGAYK